MQVQWFMCLFVNTLRPEPVLRIWDIFLNEGNHVLFRFAAALFKIAEKQILASEELGDVFQIFREIGLSIMDPGISLNMSKPSSNSTLFDTKCIDISAPDIVPTQSYL